MESDRFAPVEQMNSKISRGSPKISQSIVVQATTRWAIEITQPNYTILVLMTEQIVAKERRLLRIAVEDA
jgi:hypothetical protein